MSKKVLISAIFVALLASSVGGIFEAKADTIYPYGGLVCSPVIQQSVNSGDLVSFSAYYNSYSGSTQFGQLTWQAIGGSPSNGTGSYFSTRFYPSSINTTQVITVTDGYQTSSCTVYVNGSYYPTPTPTPYYYYPTPTPYFYGYGNVTMNHSVTNVTRGGQGNSVTAYNGDSLRFTTTITTGSQYAGDVHVRDWLPSHVAYVTGSTRVNGSYYGDAIATGNSNNSLALGDLAANQTYTVTFDGTLNGAPNQVLTNSVNVHVRGFSDQNRMSTISVVGSYYPYPTPTIYPTPYVTPTPYVSGQGLSLVQYGRDVTRGQSGQYTSVVARGNDTVDLILRVRNTSASTMSNVYVTDILPAGLNLIANSTTINSIVTANGITTSGLNIGTLYPGQESVIKFSVMIDPNFVPSWGQVDLFNTAQVRADTISMISSQLPVTLGGAASLAAISRVKTGPADSVLLALLVSVVVTGIAAMYMDFKNADRKELNFLR